MKLGMIKKSPVVAGALYPGVAQLVARLLWEQEARGSSPRTPTIKSHRRRPMAFLLSDDLEVTHKSSRRSGKKAVSPLKMSQAIKYLYAIPQQL